MLIIARGVQREKEVFVLAGRLLELLSLSAVIRALPGFVDGCSHETL